MRLTFKRMERLKSRKVIGRLFKKGQSHGAYPLRLIWLEVDGSDRPPQEEEDFFPPVQFGVSVPKRNFKSAVARNRLKRRVKEAWRLNKPWLYKQLIDKEKHFAFMMLYTGREELTYQEIEKALRKLNWVFMKKTFPVPEKTPESTNPKEG